MSLARNGEPQDQSARSTLPQAEAPCLQGYVLDLEDTQSILHFGYFKTRVQEQQERAPQQAPHLERRRPQVLPTQRFRVLGFRVEDSGSHAFCCSCSLQCRCAQHHIRT